MPCCRPARSRARIGPRSVPHAAADSQDGFPRAVTTHAGRAPHTTAAPSGSQKRSGIAATPPFASQTTPAFLKQRARAQGCRRARPGRPAEAPRGSTERTRRIGTTYSVMRSEHDDARTPSLSLSREAVALTRLGLAARRGRRRDLRRRGGHAAWAVKCWCSFRRLWVVAIRRHSVLAADLPRRAKRMKPRLCLVLPKIGSISCARCL
jgi:hypothetical protein